MQDGITNRVGSDEFLPVCSPSLLLLSFCLPAKTVRCSGGWSLFNVELQNSEVHSFQGLSLRFIHDCIPHCVLYAAVKIDGFGFICVCIMQELQLRRVRRNLAMEMPRVLTRRRLWMKRLWCFMQQWHMWYGCLSHCSEQEY